MSLLKTTLNGMLSPFDLEIRRKPYIYHCSYLWSEDAKKAGMDVNDFVEKDHLKPAPAELAEVLFPYISGGSVVCELGPGTGCYTRRIAEKITGGEFHIVDFDQYTIDFLKQYLKPNPRVQFHVNNGSTLPFSASDWMDAVFCTSMFTGINLTYFAAYIKEFSRVLKPGGHAVFDYFDVATKGGWDNLMENMARERPIFNYNYHATGTIDKLVDLAGLQIVKRVPTIRGSTFVVATKIAK